MKEVFSKEFLIYSTSDKAHRIKNYIIKVTFGDTDQMDEWGRAVINLGSQCIDYLLSQYEDTVPYIHKKYLIK